MADAKKCDECGDLYEKGSSPNVIHPKLGKVKAIVLKFLVGKDSIDLCSSCKQSYAEDILDFYTEV